MTLYDDFNKYCVEKFNEFDLTRMYNRIKDSGEYCSRDLRELLATAIYVESNKKSSDHIPKLGHYLSVLSDKDSQDNITISALLFIVALCSKIRDGTKSPTIQSNLYM
jgi:hypothetical protein